MKQEDINKLFEHYINLKVSMLKSAAGSYNEAWLSGACDEAERWLKIFNVDVSYNRVQSEIKKKMKEG